MLKKTALLFLTILIILPYCTVFAAMPDYLVHSYVREALCGEPVPFDITTPGGVFQVKAYVDNKYCCDAQLREAAPDSKLWTAAVLLDTAGERKISFRSYSKSGELLAAFPEQALNVDAKHLPPVTDEPVVLDSDRAVLLGTPPVYCGYRQSSYGFYFGASRDSLTETVRSNPVLRGQMNKLLTELSPNTTYYYQAYVVTSIGIFTGDIISFTTPPKKTWSVQDAIFADTADRYMFLFGKSDMFYTKKSPPFGYANRNEALEQIVKVKVPVWKLRHGSKTASEMAVFVNYKLEENVKAIFQSIFELDIQFPVITLNGYKYRNISGPGLNSSPILSHHSFGAAIDINKAYNGFYSRHDKRNPNNPYYIPQAVINIFAEYGWAWGGNFKEGFDTMHFQYLGLDLTN